VKRCTEAGCAASASRSGLDQAVLHGRAAPNYAMTL